MHGCRQGAEDFAAGTRLDELADAHGVVVIYPEQDERANGNRCWNWFLPENQRRDGPEPSRILDIVEGVVRAHDADRSRIFVTGLSAGAAAAAVLAEQAPDVFAGVALMAGVPLHAAHDVVSAYAAMAGERVPDPIALGGPPEVRAAYARSRALIWTGSDDLRVIPANARILAAQFCALYDLEYSAAIETRLEDGVRLRWLGQGGATRLELREIDGLAHAWSGGSLRGSYTAPGGPDLSDTIMRFFLGEAHTGEGLGGRDERGRRAG